MSHGIGSNYRAVQIISRQSKFASKEAIVGNTQSHLKDRQFPVRLAVWKRARVTMYLCQCSAASIHSPKCINGPQINLLVVQSQVFAMSSNYRAGGSSTCVPIIPSISLAQHTTNKSTVI